MLTSRPSPVLHASKALVLRCASVVHATAIVAGGKTGFKTAKTWRVEQTATIPEQPLM